MSRPVTVPPTPPGAEGLPLDALTGLPRREELLRRGPALIERAARTGRPAVLLVLDLDGFKELNDIAGHHAGDQVLAEIGRRLRSRVGDDDLAVRLGGDEFAVLSTATGVLDDAPRRSRDLIEALSAPVEVDDLSLSVGVSVGLASSDQDGPVLESLLRAADQAMYAAKSAGPGQWRASTPPGSYAEGRVRRLVEDLQSGVAAHQLQIHYQPQVATADGRIVGFEALVRWQHDDFGLLTAREFVPLAERSGAMGAITAAVLELALGDHATLRDYVPGARLSINVTRRHILARGLVDDLDEAVRRHGCSPQDLVLEITEPMTSFGPDGAEVFSVLARLGYAVSIRGFGTARSSLTTLWNNPAVREVKVAPALVGQVSDDKTQQLVHALTSAAHGLGIRVVADGVEQGSTGSVLARLGCDALQGYWVSPPARLADLREWCGQWSPARVRALVE